MTLNQIYYAIVISETGSMNKAAEKLFISQPTLTSAIQELEKELKINIFIRTGRGVVQTNEGTEFLMQARQLYTQYRQLADKYNGEKIKRKFGVSTQHYSFAVKAFVEMVKKYDTSNYDFAIRETKTWDVIQDVGTSKSEIGILFLSSFNRKTVIKLLEEQKLKFYSLKECSAYVYLWKHHPLASQKSICFSQLLDYPCLAFEQGERSSAFLAEEILSENDYPRMIRACDRATMLNLMVGLNGYTLCSGIICQELNGSDYVVVPFEADEENPNSVMEIGYIIKKQSILSEIGETYIEEIKKYLGI